MTCIVTNQKTENAVEAGLAFRYAYNRAKFWKACIWVLALLLAIIQTGVSIYVFSGHKPPFDPSYLTALPLLAFVLISTLGKCIVSKWQSLGCDLQRLHDYLTMGVGVKPSLLELPQSKVSQLSAKREKKAPNDPEQLATWWSSSLRNVPYPIAKLIATYSTFSWESALRRRYQQILTLFVLFSIGIPVALSMIFDHTLLEFAVFVFAPFTPIVAVVIDEWLTNKQSEKIAKQLSYDCYNTWNQLLSDKLDLDELEVSTEQHMGYWQNFRQSSTPIFEWLYQLSRESMEKDMLVDTNALIAAFKKK